MTLCQVAERYSSVHVGTLGESGGIITWDNLGPLGEKGFPSVYLLKLRCTSSNFALNQRYYVEDPSGIQSFTVQPVNADIEYPSDTIHEGREPLPIVNIVDQSVPVGFLSALPKTEALIHQYPQGYTNVSSFYLTSHLSEPLSIRIRVTWETLDSSPQEYLLSIVRVA